MSLSESDFKDGKMLVYAVRPYECDGWNIRCPDGAWIHVLAPMDKQVADAICEELNLLRLAGLTLAKQAWPEHDGDIETSFDSFCVGWRDECGNLILG